MVACMTDQSCDHCCGLVVIILSILPPQPQQHFANVGSAVAAVVHCMWSCTGIRQALRGWQLVEGETRKTQDLCSKSWTDGAVSIHGLSQKITSMMCKQVSRLMCLPSLITTSALLLFTAPARALQMTLPSCMRWCIWPGQFMQISWHSMKMLARRCSGCRPAWWRRSLQAQAVSGDRLSSTRALEAADAQLQG